MIPLVHFIAIFQGVINRLYGFTVAFNSNQIEISALFWMQNIFDFVQRIVVGAMFGLNPLFLKKIKKIFCCCFYGERNKQLESER